MKMQSTPQTGPTMTAVLIALRAPRGAACKEDSLPVAPFLLTGTTRLYSPASILAPVTDLPALIAIKLNAVPTLPPPDATRNRPYPEVVRRRERAPCRATGWRHGRDGR